MHDLPKEKKVGDCMCICVRRREQACASDFLNQRELSGHRSFEPINFLVLGAISLIKVFQDFLLLYIELSCLVHAEVVVVLYFPFGEIYGDFLAHQERVGSSFPVIWVITDIEHYILECNIDLRVLGSIAFG